MKPWLYLLMPAMVDNRALKVYTQSLHPSQALEMLCELKKGQKYE